jgi:phosphatidylinositol glycan class Z
VAYSELFPTLGHAANAVQKRSGVLASSLLGFLVVAGVFNRITFPAFLVVPSLSLLPHFQRKSVSRRRLYTFS